MIFFSLHIYFCYSHSPKNRRLVHGASGSACLRLSAPPMHHRTASWATQFHIILPYLSNALRIVVFSQLPLDCIVLLLWMCGTLVVVLLKSPHWDWTRWSRDFSDSAQTANRTSFLSSTSNTERRGRLSRRQHNLLSVFNLSVAPVRGAPLLLS